MNYMPPAAAAEAQTLNDRAAREAGRNPGEIRRSDGACRRSTVNVPYSRLLEALRR
jgi:hypothetical protein